MKHLSTEQLWVQSELEEPPHYSPEDIDGTIMLVYSLHLVSGL